MWPKLNVVEWVVVGIVVVLTLEGTGRVAVCTMLEHRIDVLDHDYQMMQPTLNEVINKQFKDEGRLDSIMPSAFKGIPGSSR